MTGRRRTLLLALLAVAVPLPALAASQQSLNPVSQTTTLSVSTSLDSCGLVDAQIICQLSVSYNSIPGATSYSATVTRADGSVVDYGGVGAGGTSLWVPYVGSGNYSVRITAYGEPLAPEGEKTVISTEVSGAKASGKGATETDQAEIGDAGSVQSEAGPRGDGGGATVEADGAVEATPACSQATPPPAPPVTQPLPEPPPIDVDPENPDEDSDGVADDQERVAYDAAVAEQQAAESVPELPESVDCAPTAPASP